MPDETPVLSVPAGRSYDLILEHFIYSCPDTPAYAYDDTELIAFRTAEGHMEKLFRINRIVGFDPRDIEATYDVPQNIRERISGYLTVAANCGILDTTGRYRFYILNEDGVKPLPHAPRASERLKGAHYFTHAELTAGRVIVTPIP